MIVQFQIHYKTHYGQNLLIRLETAGSDAGGWEPELALHYEDDGRWTGRLDLGNRIPEQPLRYYYIIREAGKDDMADRCMQRSLPVHKLETAACLVVDDWQEYQDPTAVFQSKPFSSVFVPEKNKETAVKKATHYFQVFCPHLPDGFSLCMLGAGKKLGDWEMDDPVLLKCKKGSWSARFNFAKEKFPLTYKYGVYDHRLKKVIFLEEGENRVLYHAADADGICWMNQFTRFPQYAWRGTGLNVQLSSLKSETSWGIGDFTDLNLVTDLCVATGFKMIQLLPINDTIATHDKKDSYPYSAISAFALHPAFMNVEKLAQAAAVELPGEMLDRVSELNQLDHLDYEAIAPIKREAIRMVYQKERFSFKDDFGYFEFFDVNRHWLVPYAAFSYLRDKHDTVDYSQWGAFSHYSEEQVQELVSPDHEAYEEIAFHYYTQYHLHLQLLDAVSYAHKHRVIIKGDLPIGVGRHSVDTWMYPSLFHMDMQAGAPPDAFTTKGQNWSFPTYNWDAMKKDGYAWWRQRMEQMSNYFDAIRIDHVLGFFRIWSIPMHAVEGIFGRFIPTIPLYAEDFSRAGLYFDEQRYCDPYINEDILYRSFGDQAGWVKEHLMDGMRFKAGLSTQREIASYLSRYPEKQFLKQPLFDLLGSVILLRDENRPGAYHFRISMHDTDSYKHLSGYEQNQLNPMYRDYFFETQNGLWYQEVQSKLNAIQHSSGMLICAEDLGMVPEMVEGVLRDREMLSLQVQRMPKVSTDQFTHPGNASYLTVVTPSTHDMSTIRQWWEEDHTATQLFFNQILGHYGEAPYYCEPWVAKDIIQQHVKSPAMWAVFLLQDILAMSPDLRKEDPNTERINIPADPDHYWNYRMHIGLEQLLADNRFCLELKQMIQHAGR